MIICKICNSSHVKTMAFANHIRYHHKITIKEYYDSYIKKENEGFCNVCGSETRFNNVIVGYKKHCSNLKCAAADKDTLQKRKQTNLQKYGDENYINVDKMKITKSNFSQEKKLEILDKRKQTNNEIYQDPNFTNKTQREITKLERYGDKNFTNRIKANKTINEKYSVDNVFKLDSTKEKSYQTKSERYGNPFFNNNQKMKQTKLERYDDENYINVEKIKFTSVLKRKENIIDELKNTHISLVNADSKEQYVLHCNNCNQNFEITSQLYYLRIKNNEDVCLHCNSYNNASKKEIQILDFIKENYDGEIIVNNRNIITPLELDVYLPKLKLAFEFNGIYWHNELFVDNNYHYNKTDICEKQGIHLIHIYEDQWVYKQDIVKSRILNALGLSKKIFARKTEIREVPYIESVNFLEENHIQSNAYSSIRLGLYYENELVSLMTFCGLRNNLGQKNIDGHYELLRLCSKINTTVIGAANKLFKYFTENYKPINVISYADRSWTMNNGNTVYDKLGFKFRSHTSPNYYYVVDGIRKNRFNFRKDVLVNEGYDTNKTEKEIMLERKIYRIYDSGQLKYVWKKL